MLKILTPLLTALAGEELRLATRRVRRAAIFGAVVAVFGLIALIFLCVAAFLALAQNYGGPIAALILAALSLIIALLVLAVLKIQAAAEEKKRKQRIEADKSALMATAAIATVPSILKRPILAVALPLAGVILVNLLSDKKKR
ncbi:phage holin family protein [Falsochrobactrum sp. TDYN1]|uniref:Phage holin family protein n=1 Tax=Falsochrobactrum tianjinense TaxID=2706015 RepID=A0A949UUA4_9HYPH|nr:phage holin family protein [Falsochrobactrum sp. TDYN1]MBV2144690.1 phage holin family protein [Falsochrobactrum sp. TDYN1]